MGGLTACAYPVRHYTQQTTTNIMEQKQPTDECSKQSFAQALSLGIAVGVGVGTALGVAMHSVGIGIGIGAGLGISLSFAFDGKKCKKDAA